MNTPLLQVEDVRGFYGPVESLHGVSIEVVRGEIVVVLGANGAGKTTLMRAVSRNIRVTGAIRFDGKDITRSSPEAVAVLGVGHVPEGRGTFVDLSVDDNLALGRMVGARRGSDAAFRDEVLDLFPVLREMGKRRAGSLSGGQQQILAIARALLGRPELLIIDELSLGLAPMITREIFDKLADLRDRIGLSILLAEQNVNLSLAVADRGYVLDSGSLVAEGAASTLASSGAVERAYLGK